MRSVMIKSAILAFVSAVLLACGGGGPADIMKKGMDFQEQTIEILEANKDNPDKAAEALEKFATDNAGEIAKVKEAGEKLEKMFKDDPSKAMEMMSELAPMMERMQELMKRQMALPAELTGNEAVMAAMKKVDIK